MKTRVLHLMTALLIFSPCGVAYGQDSDAVSAKIIAGEKKWSSAYQRRDVAAMESLLADDFLITVEDGATFSKTGYIAHVVDSSVKVDIAELSDMKVRVHASTAVVTGAYHEKGVSKGKPYEYHDRFTDVWMNLNGRWQVVGSHYSIPASQ